MQNAQQRNKNLSARAQHLSSTTVRLGEMLTELVENQLLPQRAKFESLLEVWSELLPADISEHCRIADICGGQLKVLVDSAAYMYELQLRSSGILSEVRRRCPWIKKIKVAVG